MKIRDLVKEYKSFFPTGGNCHIVLDDGNIETNNIRFCMNECEDKNDVAGYFIMSKMYDMTLNQRNRLVKYWSNYKVGGYKK